MTCIASPTREPSLTGTSDGLAVPVRRVRLWELYLLALILAAVNALKPLHIDDAAYYEYARQIARHPLDPLGFSILWYQTWQPAQQVLAPPVLPYWWAAGIWLFGDRPVLWKLWLFPFCALFAWALARLLARFATGLHRPLLWMTVLSPVFVPSLNLMLDIPALALGSAAIVLFLSSVDRSSLLRALVAGLLAGLSMQTKYTGLLVPVVFFLCAVTAARHGWLRNLVLAFVAGGVAALVFVGWEAFLVWRYPASGSHFLYHLHDASSLPLLDRLGDGLATLPGLLGSMAAAVGLLGILALTVRRWPWAVGTAWIMVTYLAVVCVGAHFRAQAHVHLWWRPTPVDMSGPFPLEALLYGSLGIAVIAILATVCWRLVRLPRGMSKGMRFWMNSPVDWFLIGWLFVELAGYFALSPFPAVRRLMGLVIVSTLLTGRLASRAGVTPARRRLVWGVAMLNLGLAALYGTADLGAAQSAQKAAQQAAAWILHQETKGNVVWFSGHWGFQFYAEQAGMRPVAPGETRLSVGDWLVVPDASLAQQEFQLNLACLERVHTVRVSPLVPFTTVAQEYGGYYGTGTGAPLLHQDGPQLQVSIYRVRQSYLCQ